MASKPTVTLTFAGDSVDLEKKFADVGQAASGLDGDFDKAESSAADLEQAFREVGSAAESSVKVDGLNTALLNSAAAGDVAERALIGVADIAGFMTNQIGLNLGPMEEWTRGFADLGGAAGSLLPLMGEAPAAIGKLVASTTGAIASTWAYVSALTAQAVAFIAANAPIIAIIASIALLAAGIVLLIKYWDEIVAAVPGLQPAIDLAKQGLDLLTGAFDAVLKFLRTNWPEIATILSGPFAPLVLLATDAFGVRSKLEGAIGGAKDFIGGAVDDIVGFFTGLPGRVSSAASGAFDSVSDAFTDALNAIISAWNGLKIPGFSLGSISIPRVQVGIPGILGGGSVGIGGGSITLPSFPEFNFPDIPKLHAGGVVPGTPGQEMLALLRGGERVLPDSRGAAGINVVVNALDPRAAADAVIAAINEFEQRNGQRYARS